MLPKGQSDESSSLMAVGEWEGAPITYRTNRIIVKFRPPSPDSERSAADIVESVRSVIPEGSVVRAPGPSGRAVFAVAASTDVIRLAQELTQREDVEYAEPDVIDSAQLVPTDTRYPDQWALPKVDAPTAWDATTGTASGILIGVIDSGISMSVAGALDHPDLNQPGRYILGTDFVDGGTPRDLNGHGTHVAGIAAAESNNTQGVCGMNWTTPVYICRTLDAAGNGSSSSFASAVEEIVDYAVANNLKAVINYSGGGAPNQTKKDACKYVNDHGMILCAAAGNDYGGPVIFPAAYSTIYDGVIAVGSTNADDTVSNFSNVGPEVTVVAPGNNILSTTPTYAVGSGTALNYDYLSGTSMATPLVASLVAMMWGRHPSFTNTRIRTCLTSTAKKLGAGTFDNSWGNGRVDANKAVRCGDIVFTSFTRLTQLTRFTSFTSLTRFTPITRFTRLTSLTRFTNLTRFSPFTRLTIFTRFTSFTPLTRFTIFTRFTRIVTFTRPPGPDPRREWMPEPAFGGEESIAEIRPFRRFGNMVFDTEELDLRRFEELESIADDLLQAGIETIDELAASDPYEISGMVGLDPADGNRLVELAQIILRQMVHEE